MLKSRVEIKAIARERYRENRGTPILILLVFMIIALFYSGLTTISSLLLLFPLMWLATIIFWPVIYVMAVNIEGEFVKLYQGQPASVGAIFSGFSINFWRKFGGMLWMALWVSLWTYLLIIPGIVKAIAYSMAPFILATHPDVTAREALKLSMRITAGHKGKLFVMYLSFIGWQLLSMLTFGILGIVFVNPYYYLTCAGYFVELRDHAIANGTIRPEELGMPAIEEGVNGDYF